MESYPKLHMSFSQMACKLSDTGAEYWNGRDLQMLFGYANWNDFEAIIIKAINACRAAGYRHEEHFRLVIDENSKPTDIVMTKFACYMAAMNGDSTKKEVAFAQIYFASQTGKLEEIQKNAADMERIEARKKLVKSEKDLSAEIQKRLGNGPSFGVIRDKGNRALFGGHTTDQMKARLGVPQNRPLADFLPTITIKAKDFANEITNFNVKTNNLKTEQGISQEHVRNNQHVRRLLVERNIVPENLPPAEDLKKVERRIESNPKKLAKGRIPADDDDAGT